MSTYLCFDFGTKSIGVAVGQLVTETAQPLEAIPARDGIPDWEQVKALHREWLPERCIVGIPYNMDGTEQEMTLRARKFGNRLANQCRTQVTMIDERLTTTDAKARLFELGGYKKLSKGKVDSVSACVIFENWLEQGMPE
ncbi:Holliday junction resolvase RuvX [Alteromonas sp. LMIT006]|jgi:putative Holliday junction resolvase|uniref:Holliday junction resolvase RuvX n=1 Tax=Alteromonadaceae TaxID=72275 RepID=UPI0019E23B0F|nr:Holliday junction resolvase RuvX [Alteromonas sp. LMIT006]MBE1287704.1 Holliday junction resolvase RuvX [Alteromonadaceae bacterium]UTP73697.1 Holliday junction resolvase RuvX [Alteromonas sp. LMIT006]